MPPLPSVSYQFRRCFNVCIFLLQIFFHVVNPRFPLSSSVSHSFNVAVECLVWESIIFQFHSFYVTKPCTCKSSFLDFVDYCFSCASIFLIVSFLTLCNVQPLDSQYFSEPTYFCRQVLVSAGSSIPV